MTVDSIARLAAANPVTDMPSVESPERLRRLIACPRMWEDESFAIDLGEGRVRRSRVRRPVFAAVAVAAAASVAAVLLTAGSSGPGVNVAAAAYAATTPPSGVVEAVFLARIFRGSQAGGTLRQREWNDASARLRRVQNSTTGPYGDTRETHVLEMAFAPGRWEVWSSGPEANTITRAQVPTPSPRANLALGVSAGFAFGGISLEGVEGIELYRQLYTLGFMRLVGRERHGGRSLWKLESRPAGHTRTDHMRLVVLVDPKTFLPVSERQVDVALPGHPTTVESNLISYRRLSAGELDPKLLDLAAQHPGARVHISMVHPRFVSMHRHRHAGKRR
jgi:hypothetical protein